MIALFPVKHVKVIIVCLMLVAAAVLLAIGPRGDKDIPNDRVVIDYWEKWTGDEEIGIRGVVDDFNNTVGKEKHIFVRYVSTSSINLKTLVATAAGVPPDVAGLWDINMVQYASLDALEPLEDMAAEHGIDEHTYKPVYWNSCHWNGHLYALISTPATIALHYNKKIFHENADKLRAAGLDPDRAPQTIDELGKYAKVLDTIGPDGRIDRVGYLPLEPGWYLNYTYMWFGGNIFDEKTQKFTLTSPAVVASYKWIQSYSKRLGKSAMNEFRGGVAGGVTNWDSPQNPFLTQAVVMIQQGPWMANHILNLNPQMDGLEKADENERLQPLAQRLARTQWAVAPFPTAVPGMKDACYAPYDTLVIPKGTKHKKEAFEFIAYINRQDVMEKLCNAHSKNSPLQKVSTEFLEHHKNPYIKVFEELANSPNAQTIPKIPIMPEVGDELTNVAQTVALLEAEPEDALQNAQDRLQAKYDDFMAKQRARTH
jgi:multiple sugar transport system substrate-binding protein